MRGSWVVLGCAVVTMMLGVGAASAASYPTQYAGAQRLTAGKVKSIDGTYCGKFSAKWLPVTNYYGDGYVTYARQAANLAKMARATSGGRAKLYRRQAAALLKRVKLEGPACEQPNGARKLTATNLRVTGAVTCGRTSTRSWQWLAGTASGAYFTSYKQAVLNAKAAARLAKGSTRTTRLREATSIAATARVAQKACNGLGAEPATPAAPVRLALKGAVGLALTSANSSTSGPGSNLDAVAADGAVSDAVTTGSLSVRKFLISPTGITYLILHYPMSLGGDTGDARCIIVAVDRESGVPSCVDDRLTSTWWGGAHDTDVVQFDDSGAVYYAGQDATGPTVLRRFDGTQHRDLVTDYARMSDFLVKGDGTVFVTGSTTTSYHGWLRRIAPDGSLHSIEIYESTFLKEFPDGNVYYGTRGNAVAVRRVISATGTVDPVDWIGDARTGARFDGMEPCGYYYCTAITMPFMRTFSGKVYAATSSGNGFSHLVRMYPDVERITTTAITKLSIGKAVLNHLFLSGLNADGHYVTTIYDTSDGTERTLIDPAQETELYHLCYSAGGAQLLFDGLRFSDNRYVFGYVDVNTGAVRVTRAYETKWDDFQAFA